MTGWTTDLATAQPVMLASTTGRNGAASISQAKDFAGTTPRLSPSLTHRGQLSRPPTTKGHTFIKQRAPVWKAGLKIFHSTSAYSTAWFWEGYPRWEHDSFRILARFAPRQLVLDIGAWIGPTVLWEAHLARRVFAVEAAPRAFKELKENVAVNPDLKDRIELLNMALGDEDGVAHVTNMAASKDRVVTTGSTAGNALVSTRSVSIRTLRADWPELEETGFVRIDLEGQESVLVPAMRTFFLEAKPTLLISLHPLFIGHEAVQAVLNVLSETFPHLYEVDMFTPFNVQRSSYTHGSHGGADVLCTWRDLRGDSVAGVPVQSLLHSQQPRP